MTNKTYKPTFVEYMLNFKINGKWYKHGFEDITELRDFVKYNAETYEGWCVVEYRGVPSTFIV